MSEYIGSDSMIALQTALRARKAEFVANPLLANGGRIMNILEPHSYGWSNVQRDAHRDGLVALTMVDLDKTLEHLVEWFGEDVGFPHWRAFTGTPREVLPACAQVLNGVSLPDGWRIDSHAHPTDELIQSCQTLNECSDVAPAPAYYLRGHDVPALLTCVHDAEGAMVACASASMRYHSEGPLADWLFAGGVSVHPDHRRKGLGALVNAALLRDSHAQFGWISVLEQAKADNAASVGMIERCGLRQHGDKVTIMINLVGGFVTR